MYFSTGRCTANPCIFLHRSPEGKILNLGNLAALSKVVAAAKAKPTAKGKAKAKPKAAGKAKANAKAVVCVGSGAFVRDPSSLPLE